MTLAPTGRQRFAAAMNLILLEPEELQPDGTAVLTDARARHVREVLRAAPGEQIRAGVVDGALGDGRLLVVGDYLMCRACGWAVRASAVGLVAAHVVGVCD